MSTRAIAVTAAVALAACLPAVANAYVGPGAGLSLAAAFWAILVAVVTIVAFTLMWPVRRLLRRRNGTGPHKARRHDETPDDGGMEHGRRGHGA